jgi:hypothetical protein
MRAGRLQPPTLWLVFTLLLLGEFALFDQVGAQHHTWVYPRWNDQIQYLTESYLAYEDAKANGFAHAFKNTLLNPSAQGTLHDTAALIVFTLAGASRSAALSLNMVGLILLQVAVFSWAWWRWKAPAAGLVGAALLLTLRSPWLVAPGSALDFRLDWPAVCLFGVALVAAEWSHGFRSSRGAVLFGLAVGLTLLTRFLTGAYFAVIFLVFALWVCWSADRWRRLGNLALAGVVAALVAGPIFWLNRKHIETYYFIGHFSGPESRVRASGMDAAESIAWVVGKALDVHLGQTYGWVLLGCLGAGVILALLRPVSPRDDSFEPVGTRGSWVPGATFAVVPLLILSIHYQKTEQVVGIAMPGLVILSLHVLMQVLKASNRAAQQWFAVSVIGIAAVIFGVRMIRDPHPQWLKSDARHTAALADYIVRTSEAKGLAMPRIAVDRITDSLDAQVLRVICYERKRRWIPFIMTLPTGIQEESPELYWERLKSSDYVFLTREGDEGRWPYDRQLAQMRPQTLAWAEENLRAVEEFPMAQQRMVLFERR